VRPVEQRPGQPPTWLDQSNNAPVRPPGKSIQRRFDPVRPLHTIRASAGFTPSTKLRRKQQLIHGDASQALRLARRAVCALSRSLVRCRRWRRAPASTPRVIATADDASAATASPIPRAAAAADASTDSDKTRGRQEARRPEGPNRTVGAPKARRTAKQAQHWTVRGNSSGWQSRAAVLLSTGDARYAAFVSQSAITSRSNA
jgi:hypothetical protein